MNASVTVQAGLVAAYAFDEGAGSTVMDASGNNNTGQGNKISWSVTGKHSAAILLDGSKAYVDLGNTSASLKQTGSMTWSAWVYVNSNPPDDGQIISQSDGISGWQFKISPDTGKRTFAIAISGPNRGLTQRYSNTVYNLKTWYHVAGVYNSATATLDIYVNGVLDNGQMRGPAIPASQYLPAANIMIGRRYGSEYYFPGLIDDLRVYNRALNQTEIQGDMTTAVVPAGSSAPSVNGIITTSLTNVGEAGSANPAMQGISLSSRPQGRVSTLSCSPKAVNAGSQVTCDLRVAGTALSSVQLVSSSNQVRLPSVVAARANQSRITFLVTVDAGAKAQEVTLKAMLGGASVEDIIHVTPASAPVLMVPGNQLARFGTPLQFQVTGVDPSDVPVQLMAAKLPAGATFDPVSGRFDWTPNSSQAGIYQITFTATNVAGRSSSAQVAVEAGSGAPVLTSAGVCSPGAISTLHGKWLAEDSVADFSGKTLVLGGTWVKVNGETVPALAVSPTQVKFLCPAIAAGTALSIVVETASAVSEPVIGVMQPVSPELLLLDRPKSDEGMVSFTVRNEYVTEIDSRMAGRPAQAGDEILIWGTGFATASRLSVRLGGVEAEVEAVRAVPNVVGLYTILTRVPAGTGIGNAVPLTVLVATADDKVVQSNTVNVAVEAISH